MTATPVRDALAAFLREEQKREQREARRMGHLRRVDGWCWLGSLGVLAVQFATDWKWLLYVWAGLLGLAWLLPASLTWPALYRMVRR